jgi:hypothetical protein
VQTVEHNMIRRHSIAALAFAAVVACGGDKSLAASAGDTIRVASATGPDLALIDHLNGATIALAQHSSRIAGCRTSRPVAKEVAPANNYAEQTRFRPLSFAR